MGAFEDMEDSGDDSAHDAYLEKMKREGKGKVLDMGDDLGSSDDSSGKCFTGSHFICSFMLVVVVDPHLPDILGGGCDLGFIR